MKPLVFATLLYIATSSLMSGVNGSFDGASLSQPLRLLDEEFSDVGKGSKKSSKKSSKSSKKGSKKGKGSKKSSSKGTSGPTHAPVQPTNISSRSAKGASRPPIEIQDGVPSSPSMAPESILDNEANALVAIPLTRYAISYTVANENMPSRDDYDELTAASDEFLEEYMIRRYLSSYQALLVKFDTTRVTAAFRFEEPVLVEFESTAYFKGTVPPKTQTLDNVLAEALDTPAAIAAYIIELEEALDDTNPFYRTIDAAFVEPGVPVVGTRSSSRSESSTVFVAGAASLSLLVAGLILFRRRDTMEDEYFNQKDFKKLLGGDRTIAGDTYSGDTCDETVSECPRSGQSPGEEEIVSANLRNTSYDYEHEDLPLHIHDSRQQEYDEDPHAAVSHTGSRMSVSTIEFGRKDKNKLRSSEVHGHVDSCFDEDSHQNALLTRRSSKKNSRYSTNDAGFLKGEEKQKYDLHAPVNGRGATRSVDTRKFGRMEGNDLKRSKAVIKSIENSDAGFDEKCDEDDLLKRRYLHRLQDIFEEIDDHLSSSK